MHTAVHREVNTRAENAQGGHRRADVESCVGVDHLLRAHGAGEHDRFVGDACGGGGEREFKNLEKNSLIGAEQATKVVDPNDRPNMRAKNWQGCRQAAPLSASLLFPLN